MSWFKALFSKKQQVKNIGHYIEYIEENPKTSFQMCVLRDGRTDLNISQTSLYKDLDERLAEMKGYSVIIDFSSKTNIKDCIKSIKEEKMFSDNKSKIIRLKGDKYLVTVNNNIQELYETIKFLTEVVLNYNVSTICQVSFIISEKDERFRLLSDLIGDNSIQEILINNSVNVSDLEVLE